MSIYSIESKRQSQNVIQINGFLFFILFIFLLQSQSLPGVFRAYDLLSAFSGH